MYQYTYDFYTYISLRKVFGIIIVSCFFPSEWAESVELCSSPAKIYKYIHMHTYICMQISEQ